MGPISDRCPSTIGSASLNRIVLMRRSLENDSDAGSVSETERARGKFEATGQNEACARSGWRLHVYLIMGIRFYLAVETPEPNLGEGMRCASAERLSNRPVISRVSMCYSAPCQVFGDMKRDLDVDRLD